jgi:hypothetical protein
MLKKRASSAYYYSKFLKRKPPEQGGFSLKLLYLTTPNPSLSRRGALKIPLLVQEGLGVVRCQLESLL